MERLQLIYLGALGASILTFPLRRARVVTKTAVQQSGGCFLKVIPLWLKELPFVLSGRRPVIAHQVHVTAERQSVLGWNVIRLCPCLLFFFAQATLSSTHHSVAAIIAHETRG